jgi:hypothetical protein
MVNRLATVIAGVDHGAITLHEAFGSGNLRSGPMEMTEQIAVFLAGVGNGGDVLSRDDKNMHRRLWVDVSKRVALIILVNSFGRNASVDDLAKEAAHGWLRVYISRLPLSGRMGMDLRS